MVHDEEQGGPEWSDVVEWNEAVDRRAAEFGHTPACAAIWMASGGCSCDPVEAGRRAEESKGCPRWAAEQVDPECPLHGRGESREDAERKAGGSWRA